MPPGRRPAILGRGVPGTDAPGPDPLPPVVAPHAAIPGAIVPQPGGEKDAADVAAQLRRAFATHPDLIYGGRDWTAAVHAGFLNRHPDPDATGGVAALAAEVAGLAPALRRTDPGLQGGEVLALPTPAVFLRTADPLLAAVIDACASGNYAHRVRPWVLRACFVDPDHEPAVDFPFLLAPREEDWQRDVRACQMDAWRIAFGIHLFGTSRDRDGHPRPKARSALRRPEGSGPSDTRRVAGR